MRTFLVADAEDVGFGFVTVNDSQGFSVFNAFMLSGTTISSSKCRSDHFPIVARPLEDRLNRFLSRKCKKRSIKKARESTPTEIDRPAMVPDVFPYCLASGIIVPLAPNDAPRDGARLREVEVLG